MTTNPTPTPAGAQEGSERASGADLSKRERFESRLRWHFDVVAEEGKGSAYISVGIANAQRDLDAIVREEVDAALGEVRANRDRLAHQVAAQRAEMEGLRARLTNRERQHAEHLARAATLGDTGICRTCVQPITFAVVEEPGYNPRTGWSDGARVDALVCFRAIDYCHVPLVGRERAIWDAATKAALDGAHPTPSDGSES